MAAPVVTGAEPDDISRLVCAGIERLRARLLDLSLANRLLSFKHSEKSRTHIRIIDEVPEILFDKLENGNKLTFAWIDAPDPDLADEQTPEFRFALARKKESDATYLEQKRKLGRRASSRQLERIERELRDRLRRELGLPPVREQKITERAKELGIDPGYDLPEPVSDLPRKHADTKIQTLHYREQMESKLATIRDSDRTLLQDAGVNALYCAFGFVEWYETATSDTALYAPLLFYPVEIERILKDGRYIYSMQSRDGDVEPNITFAELIKRNHGMELPTWEPESSLADFIMRVSRMISTERKWKLRRWVTVGLFTFSKLVMYRDLEAGNWAHERLLDKHPILQDLLVGSESVAEVPIAPEYEIDSRSAEKKIPPLVTDADSSQHSAIIDVLNGKNLVIQGPPGTGKSQTITNVIAAALNDGKKVLFIAEKMAALEVVKSRLDNFGLGHFCLELHSSKTRKTSVLQALNHRLEFRGPNLDIAHLRQALKACEEARSELLYYVTSIKQPVGQTGLTVYEVLRGNCVRTGLAQKFPPELKQARIDRSNELDSFTVQELKQLASTLEVQSSAINHWGGLVRHPWHGLQNDQLDQFYADELATILNRWAQSLVALQDAICQAAAQTGWPITYSVSGAQKFVDVVQKISSPPEEFDEEVFRRLGTNNDRALLASCLADVEQFTAMCTEIDCIVEKRSSALTIGSGRLKDTVREIQEIGFGEYRFKEIEEKFEEARNAAEILDESLQVSTALLNLFGSEVVSVGDLSAITEAISLTQKLPRDVLHLRHSEVLQDVNLSVLERGLHQAEALERRAAVLRNGFELSFIHSSASVKTAAEELASAGFFTSLFSSKCREARRLYNKITRDKKRVSRHGAALVLAGIATYLENLEKFESDDELRKVTGPYFRGIKTSWKELVTICRWAQEIRQALPAISKRTKAIRDFLLGADLDGLDGILAFARTTEYQKLLKALTLTADYSSFDLQVVAIAHRQIATRLAAILQQLRALEVSSNTTVTDLNRLVSVLVTIEELQQKLGQSQAAEILGSSLGCWIDKPLKLQHTLAFANKLCEIGFLEPAWRVLLQGPIADGLRILNDYAGAISERVSVVQHVQNLACSLGKLESRSWIGCADFEDASLDGLQVRVAFALNHMEALQGYIDFLRLENKAKASPLAPILKAFTDAGTDYTKLEVAFEFVFYRSAAEVILREDVRLSAHSGETHEKLRRRFQQLDRKILELQRQEVARRLMGNPIEPGIGRGRASEWTGLALIQRQIGLQRRHIPLRDLFTRAGQAIQALKPCFLMSPMSVAQFLRPDGIRFDLVLMDEASQIRPEDAIGAIVRGSQVVVVGDPMQLPPTAFFERLDSDSPTDDAEEAELQDLIGQESILDMARSVYQPVRQLRWHYRSQHERLIAFSNREFYKNLIVFPSPHGDDPRYGVQLVEANGVYEASLNRLEAEAIVNAAQEFMHQYPTRSLGIVAMNQPQRELILDMTDDLFKDDPEAEAYRAHWVDTLEPFFVKNLENVQGDERDVIFISTVYGKDPAGNFYQRLGPINGVHGHRRLNVLFTRAKQQIRVFTSMNYSDLCVDERTRRGVEVLKNYLQFAKTGYLDFASLSGREPDSEFERWVIQLLQEKGYEVEPQLGVAGYFIDIAVRHPDQRGSFILGIECDGRMYHSAPSVRDRDRLRQEVLERLRWKIYRIWSTDWFRNPHIEFQKLVATIEQVRSEHTS